MKKLAIIGMACGLMLAGGSAFAVRDWQHQKIPVEFYTGHSHGEDGTTIAAPQHSGGTDRFGCHNGSVPYHCH